MAENSKMVTAVHLRKLADRGKADSAARIAELADLVAVGLEEVRHTGITVTLPADHWSGGTQTVQNPAFLADGCCWYLILGAEVTADDVTANGQMTFHRETAPENDLIVNIIRLEVQA